MVQKFNDSGAMSSFNEGAVMMFRIHELQRVLNFAWLNPLQYNSDLELRNYEVIKNNLDNLLRETYPKCTKKEKEEGEKMMYDIDNYILEKPVFESVINDSYSNNKSYTYNLQNWIELKKQLQDYNFRVKEFMESHGLSAPNAESPDFAAFG